MADLLAELTAMDQRLDSKSTAVLHSVGWDRAGLRLLQARTAPDPVPPLREGLAYGALGLQPVRPLSPAEARADLRRRRDLGRGTWILAGQLRLTQARLTLALARAEGSPTRASQAAEILQTALRINRNLERPARPLLAEARALGAPAGGALARP